MKRARGAGYGIQSLGWTGNALSQWAPGGAGSGGQVLGWTFAEPAGSNASTVPALATGSFRAQLPRMRFATTATAASYAGTVSQQTLCVRGNAAGAGGLHFGARFGLSADAAAETKCFVGLSASSASMVAATSPGSVANTIGVGFDAADTAWQIIRAAGAGSTKTAITGATRNTTYVFDVSIVVAPNGASAFMWMVELTTGAVLADAVEITTALPGSTTDLYAHAEIGIVGGGTGAGLEVMSMFLEVPDRALAWSSVLVENGVADVRDFGAVGDGTTDDSDAFASALRLLGSGTLYVPPGRYKLLRSLLIDCSPMHSDVAGKGGARHILLRGAAPGSDSDGVSRLEFGPYAGIRVVGTLGDGEDTGQMVAVEDLDIIGGHGEGSGLRPPEHDEWTTATEYAGAATTGTVGDFILAPGPRSTNVNASFEYYYENVGDTEDSAGPTPAFASVQRVDPSKLWTATTQYAVGAVVRVAGRFDVFFECTTAGMSGAGPAWTYVPGGIVPDGGGPLEWTVRDASAYFAADGGTLASPTGPVWACRVAAGIYSVARFNVLRVAIRDFLNAAIHLQAPPAGTAQVNDAHCSSAYDVRIARCGAGIVTRDAVATCAFFGVQIQLYDTTDGFTAGQCDRTIGIAERCASPGSSYYGCSVERCQGPSVLVTDATSGASFFGCWTASATGAANIVSTAASVWGGSWGSGFVATSPFHGAPAPDDWRNVAVKGSAAGLTLRGKMSPDADSVWGFSADGETPFGIKYGTPETGWWSLTREPSSVLAWSGGNAAEGGAQVWAPRGIMLGDPKRLLKTATTASPPGGNGWRKGDVVLNRTIVANEPMYWQCIDTGPPSQWWPDPMLP